jgi:type IV secretory pathway VirB4 component
LEIVYYRLKSRRDGSPTRYVFDEAWHYLNTDVWLDILTEDLPSQRRQKVSSGFATQSISQIQGSRITPLLLESTTKFLLPNASALDHSGPPGQTIRDAYIGMGMGEEEIQRNIVMAESKRHMYWTIPNDQNGHPQRRLIDLRVGRLEQYLCGSNSEAAHDAMDDVLAKYPSEEFAVHWLARGGFTEESKIVAKALQMNGGRHE